MNSKNIRTVLILTIIIMAAALIARALPGVRTIDDAFITFRYSRNLVEGHGFVYNVGVQTLGTTTPLFTLTLAGISAITGAQDYQWYALAVSALADAITCALLYAITRRLIPNVVIAALPAVLWAFSPMSVTFAVGGMETSVNILWMVAATWLYFSGNKRPIADIGIGVFAALGLLTRIDAGLWIAPLFTFQLIERLITRRNEPFLARIPFHTWIAALVMTLPWVIFAWGYFGSPIPNSVTAKADVYLNPPLSGMVQFIRTYSNPFFEFDTFGGLGVTIASIAYLILSVIALIYVARRFPRLFPFLIYVWVYFAVFALANPLIFRWYMAPPLPALMLGLVIGAWAIFSAIGKTGAVILTGVLGAVWIFTSVNGWEQHPTHGLDRPAPRMAWHEIELHYQDMGTMLRDQYDVTGETRVAAGDIGAVGYFSGATIVDTIGLISPGMREYYPADPSIIVEGQNYAVPPQIIFDTMPDYIVLMEAFVRLGLERDERFTDEYELIREIPTGYYGTGMRLYQRR